MGENDHREPTYEVWVQDLTDRNLFLNRRLSLKLPESALSERSSIVLKIVYDGERPSTLPFGYERDADGKIFIDLAKADLVCRVFELHGQGLSIEKIARKIEAATSGHHTDRNADSTNHNGNHNGNHGSNHGGDEHSVAWHAANVREILDHEATYYSGILESDSSLHLPPILK